jgi:hypothetical protein
MRPSIGKVKAYATRIGYKKHAFESSHHTLEWDTSSHRFLAVSGASCE